jgi:hypothetical protein
VGHSTKLDVLPSPSVDHQDPSGVEIALDPPNAYCFLLEEHMAASAPAPSVYFSFTAAISEFNLFLLSPSGDCISPCSLIFMHDTLRASP